MKEKNNTDKKSKSFRLKNLHGLKLILPVLAIISVSIGAVAYASLKESSQAKNVEPTAIISEPETVNEESQTTTQHDATPQVSTQKAPPLATPKPSKSARCSALEVDMPSIYAQSEASAYDLYQNSVRLASERTDLTDDAKRIDKEMSYTRYKSTVSGRYYSIAADFYAAGCTPNISLVYRPS